MNGQYFKNPRFPTLDEDEREKKENVEDYKLNSYSYKEILLINKGKKIKVYCHFCDNDITIYEGTLEQIGYDFLVISDEQNKRYFMLLLDEIEHIEFSENVDYKTF